MKHFKSMYYWLNGVLILALTIGSSYGQHIIDEQWKELKLNNSSEIIDLKRPNHKYRLKLDSYVKKLEKRAIKKGEKYEKIKIPLPNPKMVIELVEESPLIDTLGFKIVEWHENADHYVSYLYYESNTNFYIFQDYKNCHQVMKDIYRISSMDGKQIPKSRKKQIVIRVKELLKRYNSIPIKLRRNTIWYKLHRWYKLKRWYKAKIDYTKH